MSGKSMDVFSLRDSIVGDYRKFATSFTTIHAEDIRVQVEAIYSEGRFWPDPLLQINPSYKRGLNLETLIANGALDPRTADIFRADGAPLSLGSSTSGRGDAPSPASRCPRSCVRATSSPGLTARPTPSGLTSTTASFSLRSSTTSSTGASSRCKTTERSS